MKATIQRNQVITVTTAPSGSLVQDAPITLKNSIADGQVATIEAIGDVEEIDVTDGATLVYNSATDKYEIKPIPSSSIPNLDGGTF